MTDDSNWANIDAIRTDWSQTDDALNDLRDVHATLAALHETLVRNKPAADARQDALAALDRLGAVDQQRFTFLAEPLIEDQTIAAALGDGSRPTPEANTVATALVEYGDGGSWQDVESACAAILEAPEHSMGIDTVALSELTTLFELAVEAGIERRKNLEAELQTTLASAYEHVAEPLGPLSEQPVALLPVRLETRFVDENGDTEGPRKELLIRVYPDQIHSDSHEEELTDKEIRWGKRFWATLWYARHPDPTVIGDDPEATYLEKLPTADLRERVASIDPASFSEEHPQRYAELEQRAWQQLLERFDRERAGYIIHALKPTDEELATDLLTEPPENAVVGDGGDPIDADIDQYATEQIDPGSMQVDIESEQPVTIPKRLPPLAFPAVERRPESWTKRARAKLLPDRWVAVAEWEDHTGESHRTAIAGDPVRDPLAVGPGAESVAEQSVDSESGGAPEGTEWLVDFQEARDVGMGLRLPLSGLSGFDPARGFTRLSVVGVRASVDPADGNDELADLLDAHHYTDGLSFMPQGTPTNNHDGVAGEDEDTPGLSTEVSPPLVETGDLSDGDLLARALAIDPDDGEDHVFANVTNADSTEQRDARHVNSALWPATIGYSMEQLYVDNELIGNPSLSEDDLSSAGIGPGSDRVEYGAWMHEEPDREDLETEMLWLDAYRRHFIRYVRARGPFPTLRVGSQPYGVLPASPIETDRELSLIDPDLIADLGSGTLDLGSLPQRGTSVAELATAGADPAKLVEAGAEPKALVDAGVDPQRMVSGGVDPEEAFDATGLVPDALMQDGIGATSSSQVTQAKLEEEGAEPDRLEAAGVTPRSLARGTVTDEQLAEAGVSTRQVAQIVLPEKARSLGLTPAALERADVTPATLLDGQFSTAQVQRLGLTTRGVADAVLPPELRELGVTPKTIADTGITPRDLLNGEVSPGDLQAAGVTTETVADALLPAEAREYGITPEAIAAADLTAADLFNGDIGLAELEAAGFDMQALESALVPDAFQEAGITSDNLLDAGITPDAVMNGQITPTDLADAGLTPTTLADAGVLPAGVADVSQVLTDLLDAGLDPMTLIERGLTPDALVDAGVTPETLIEAGLAPKRLVDTGVDVVELATSGAVSGGKLLEAGVDPATLARAGVTLADVAGGDLPVTELAKTGMTALDLASQGADAFDLASQGARPSSLREANVDAGTLRDAGKAAGSLQAADYDAGELLEAGYTAEELLNGGFTLQELSAAGLAPDEIEGRKRDVSTMLAAGHAPAELRGAGFGPEQLLDGGLSASQLAEAGYTAGELVDAGLSSEQLLSAGLTVADLRAADVDVVALLEAGVDLETLRDHGATAEELLTAGQDPEALMTAGFSQAELEVAGVDVDALLGAASEREPSTEDAGDAVVEGMGYAATVLEEPEQAQRDAYQFSFDPAIPRGPPRGGVSERSTEADEESAPDGGVQAGTVPIARPLSVDDRLDGRLRRQIRGFGTQWQDRVGYLEFGHDLTADGLVDALERTALSTDVRQKKLLYSGEFMFDAPDSFARGVLKHTYRYRRHMMRSALDDAGLDCDPRIAFFPPFDIDPEGAQAVGLLNLKYPDRYPDVPNPMNRTEKLENNELLIDIVDHHVSVPKQGIIEDYDVADANIDEFVDVLLDSSVDDVHKLGDVMREQALNSIDDPYLDVLRGALETQEASNTGFEIDQWNQLDAATKRNRVVRGMEELAERGMPATEVAGNVTETDAEKMQLLAENADEYGDSGALRSLLRILLQHGLLREYLTARRRLGLAYDDLPSPWFDPSYAFAEDDTVMDTLRDEIPDGLAAHPDVSSDTAWYREALRDAAANYSSTTSIDPRLSEFTDSLQYLAGVDSAELSTLARESLDLANHRLDAWWTSVATKQLLELREAQGSVDADGAVDHDTWDGGDSDAPRATVDPSLVGALEPDDNTGDGTVDEFDPGRVDTADRQFDPAKLVGGDAADGGNDPTETPADSVGGQPDPAGGQANSGDGGPLDDEIAFDPNAANLDAAERVGTPDPNTLDPRTASDPGLYVGGYGFVENLSADTEGRDDPEYIHAPSEQHATTAAILKSGADAHDADEGENVLALDLSADRIRAGLRLIRGVRRGQGLSELLGYRFERRLQEATVEYDQPDLMQYADVFRKEFPQRVGGVERPDEHDLKEDRLEELAARDTVDGRALLDEWDDYPFGRGGNLPGKNTNAYDALDKIASDLADQIDAAGDMLVAESVHQIGQGNFERAGGSMDALATGAQLPDPDVIEAPRTGTGLTHRHCLLVGDTDAPVGTPRGEAGPSLASWVATMLPALGDVACSGTYRWEEPQADTAIPGVTDPSLVEQEASTTLTLDVLDLGPLDVLLLFGASREETRSELEQRLAYHLIRDRPAEVPVDAEVDLDLTKTDGEVSVAELLELARSLREFVQSARPATAKDLAHPGDFDGEGYTAETADDLRDRANDAQDTLYQVAVDIDERLALFDADHALGDGTDGLDTIGGVASDGGTPGNSWDNVDGSTFVPQDDLRVIDQALTIPTFSLPEEVDFLVDAVSTVDEEVPLETVESVANDIDPSTIRSELSNLLSELPAGSASPRAARADHRVESEAGQEIDGLLMSSVDVPDVDPGSPDDGSDDGGGDTAGDDGSGDGTGDDGLDPSASGPIAWGETDPAGEDIMGVTEPAGESVQLAALPELQQSEPAYVVDQVDLADSQPIDAGPSDESGSGSESDDVLDIDWSDSTVTVRVWGTDGTGWFEREKTTSPDEHGNYSVTVDFSGVDPGISFQVVAVVDGTILDSATGRVVDDGDLTADAQSTLRSECDTLRRLVWLLDHEELLSTETGASAQLVSAHDGISDWERIRSEPNAVDPATSTVTGEELAAVDDIAGMETFDPAALPEGVEAATAPVERLGLHHIVSTTGEEGGPDDHTYWLGPTQRLTGVRARITRTLADPSLYNDGAAPRLLKYDHEAAALLHDLDGGAVASAYLDAFLAQPAWTLRYLDRELDATAQAIVRNLTAWLYDPDSLDSGTDLAAEFTQLATAARDLPALSALFEDLPRGEADTGHEAFASHLEAVAVSLGSVSYTSDASPDSAFDTAASDATTDLRTAVSTERAQIDAVVRGPPGDDAFRKIGLEQLRETMTTAASYGVYGGTPSEPDGGSVDVSSSLLEQARALLERLRSTLADASALDPRIEPDLGLQPVPQRIETQTDRLERLFGDGFTVLPPFSPTNPDELAATFTDDGLLPEDHSLAAETWLQRSASHRERVAKFREARSYGEAIAGSLTPSLSVGQIPYEEGDTWVGVEGVEPEPGRVSLVAQFGPGLTPSFGAEQLVGLSVDEWNETVPSAEETTGIALNYDDPGNRAPQSILLVPPPSDGPPTLDHLAATVAETAQYAKRRAVGPDELEAEYGHGGSYKFDPPFGLMPALQFPDRNASSAGRSMPQVDFQMVDWYDKTIDTGLFDSFGTMVDPTQDVDLNIGGDLP